MSSESNALLSSEQPWKTRLWAYFSKESISLFFLGFSAGLPLLLIFSSLSLWLQEAGLDKSVITYFSWAALGYSFKFLWAPLVDQLPVPWLTRQMGQRRSWLLLSQLSVAAAIVLMGSIDPTGDLFGNSLRAMACAAVFLGFSSATQDIAIDAYRIECAEPERQNVLAAMYVGGYRVAMLVSGAVAIAMAEWLGSSAEHYYYQAWQVTYYVMAACMGVGILVTLMVKEPQQVKTLNRSVFEHLRFFVLFVGMIAVFVLTYYALGQWLNGWASQMLTNKAWLLKWDGFWVNTCLATDRACNVTEGAKLSKWALFVMNTGIFSVSLLAAAFLALLGVWLKFVNKALVKRSYFEPIADFFKRYHAPTAVLLLSIIALYRISDILLGNISNLFYADLGFTKQDIALAVKTVGLWMVILGGFLGGWLALSMGVMRTLWVGAALATATNLLFMVLAYVGKHEGIFYAVVVADNLAAGLASAAFIAFLSALTNVKFTATQYAIFSSLMTLTPKLLGGYSGTLSEIWGYPTFFLFTAIVGLPVLVLLFFARSLLSK